MPPIAAENHAHEETVARVLPPVKRVAGLRFLVSLLALGSMAPASVAQSQEQAPPAPAFGDVIDVEVVNVRVWVTDRRGRPVTGLAAEDFSVELDGKPVTITNFSESRRHADAGEEIVERPEPGRADAAPGEAAADRPQAPASPRPAAPDTTSRFVFYVDELHMGALDRRRVVEDLRRLVADGDIPPASVLILQQAADLRRIVPFGSSAGEVDAALSSLLSAPAGGDRAPISKKLAVQRLWQLWEDARQLTDRDPCQFFTRTAEREAVVYAQQAAARGRVTLRHLEEVSSFLAGLEGFKALLYVGEILEIRPGEDLLEIVGGLCPRTGDALPGDVASEQLSTLFDRVASRANAGNVTLYTLQAGGLRTGSGLGPDQRSADIRVSGAFDRALRRSDRGGLEQLALQTGGEAFLNRNRFKKALGDVAEDLESFYSLGFPPPAGRRQGRIRLQVEVRGDGLRVRHRESFELRSVRRQMYEQVMSAIHLGESYNPLGVRLASGSLQRGEDAGVTLPLFVRVPVEAVTFLPTASGEVAELEVMVVARSPQYRGGPPVTRVYRLRRPAQASGLLDLAMELQLLPGGYVVGVGVRDRAAGVRSFVSTSIGVGDAEGP